MKMMTRSSGILMPMSSLPSPYGIGTMGKAAYEFIDFLKAAGQKYWQLLPMGPTSYGDSPYASFSTFAGNPYFIDLDMLIEDGLLKKTDLKGSYGSVDLGATMAVIMLSIIPIILVYMFCQKHIIKGVAAGAVKG